jgi:phosphonate transport system substrate-binding protein
MIPLPCLAHQKHDVIKLAVFPYKSPKSIIEVFGPIAVRLEERLGRKVQLVSAPDAASFLVKGLAGEYDMAIPTTTVYFKMLPAGYTPIAKGVPDIWGCAIVRKDSDISTIRQCRGKKIAAIGEHSYAGYMFFKALLEKQKINMAKDLEIHFLGKIDTVIYGVLNKKYDVGLIRNDTLDIKDFAPIKGRFRVIARSIDVPQFPFVVKNSLDQQTVAAVREVLTSLSPNNPEDLKILKG